MPSPWPSRLLEVEAFLINNEMSNFNTKTNLLLKKTWTPTKRRPTRKRPHGDVAISSSAIWGEYSKTTSRSQRNRRSEGSASSSAETTYMGIRIRVDFRL